MIGCVVQVEWWPVYMPAIEKDARSGGVHCVDIPNTLVGRCQALYDEYRTVQYELKKYFYLQLSNSMGTPQEVAHRVSFGRKGDIVNNEANKHKTAQDSNQGETPRVAAIPSSIRW